MGTIIAVCILSAGIGVALGYWIKTLRYWHNRDLGNLAKDSIFEDKKTKDLEDRNSILESENKNLRAEKEDLEKKQELIKQKAIQKKFDEFCSSYKSDAIARIKVKTEDGTKKFTSFIDEKAVIQSMRKLQDKEYLRFCRIQSKTQACYKIYNGYSHIKEYYDQYYWGDGLIKPEDRAIDWKITTMYIKLADLESVDIDKNMEEYI